jgi:hypothetical protein
MRTIRRAGGKVQVKMEVAKQLFLYGHSTTSRCPQPSAFDIRYSVFCGSRKTSPSRYPVKGSLFQQRIRGEGLGLLHAVRGV